MNMKQQIAKRLIEKYHKSSKFKNGDNSGSLSISLEKDKRYNDDDYSYRMKFNETALQMEKEGLIKIEGAQPSVIIERIRFEVSYVPRLYEVSGVSPKEDEISDLLSLLNHYYELVQADWLKAYFNGLVKQVEDKRSVPAIIDFPNRELLFKALVGLEDNQNTEIYERVFSKKYLGNSKAFEKEIRSRVVSVVKRHLTDDFEEDADVLGMFGIVKTTNDLLLKGELIIEVDGKVIDLSGFKYGLGLDDRTLSDCRIVTVGFNHLLSIENKANFNDTCLMAGHTLYIFSSGFYSPIKISFLKKIREFVQERQIPLSFSHWGDLDFGGFMIFNHIKGNIPELKPYKMNIESFIEGLDYAEAMTSKQKANLRNLVAKETFNEFHPLINKMLEESKVLEQEALLIR